MARGTPDYDNPVNQISTKQIDTAQVTRSILNTNLLDGKGTLYWYDDFHTNLSAWFISNFGNSANPVIDGSFSEAPPSSCKIDGGLINSDSTGLTRYYQMSTPSVMGAEISVFWSSARKATGNISTGLSLDYFNGTYLLTASIKISQLNSNIQIRDNSGWNTILTYDPTYGGLQGFLWTPIKIVANFITGKYVRLIIGQTTVDISSYNLKSVGTSLNGMMDISIFAYNESPTTAPRLYSNIGHCILTVDEP